MERTTLADALAVGRHMTADNLGLVHLDSRDLFRIVNCSKDRHIGVALAATWTTDLAEPC